MEKQIGVKRDEDKWLRGLHYARSLNFTDEQYEKATELIDKFDNANQLLVALLDVSAANDECGSGAKQVSSPNVDVTTSIRSNKDTSSNFEQLWSQKTMTELVEPTTSPSSSSTSLSIQTTSGFVSSENQSLECLTTQQNTQYQHQHDTSNQPQAVRNSSHRQQLQRSRSHQPTTSTLNCMAADRRPIYIDGPNVAKTHGKDLTFSWPGIKLCVDWFTRRNHRVKVIVPADKSASGHGSPKTAGIINFLRHINALIETPPGCNDDMFVIRAAMEKNGVIVSNDQYRDEKRTNSDMENFINLNRLPYIFDDDHFIPASDPLGRTGPTLEEFLRFDNSLNITSSQHMRKQSLCRTKSHQRQ